MTVPGRVPKAMGLTMWGSARAITQRRSLGFTLLEMLFTVSLLAILASIALPAYVRVLERRAWRHARDMLEAIYTGERIFYEANGGYYDPDPRRDWEIIHMDNPHTPSIPVTFQVTLSGSPPDFVVRAERRPGRWMTTDSSHVVVVNNWTP